MAVKTMADYLPIKVADYTIEVFEFWPEEALPERGEKNQIGHRYDDRTFRAVTLSSGSFFTMDWQFLLMPVGEAGEMVDLYHNESKANGMAKTWYWKHPLSENVYVVRFLNKELPKTTKAGVVGYVEISGIQISVEGVKA